MYNGYTYNKPTGRRDAEDALHRVFLAFGETEYRKWLYITFPRPLYCYTFQEVRAAAELALAAPYAHECHCNGIVTCENCKNLVHAESVLPF